MLLGTFGGGFGWGEKIFRVYYINNNLSHLFPPPLGGRTGWM